MLEANELSLVLVLMVNDGNVKFNVLLAADASSAGISRALTVWREHAQERSTAVEFQAIKIPHHGSIKNHFPDLGKLGCEAEAKVAAVSVLLDLSAAVLKRPHHGVSLQMESAISAANAIFHRVKTADLNAA